MTEEPKNLTTGERAYAALASQGYTRSTLAQLDEADVNRLAECCTASGKALPVAASECRKVILAIQAATKSSIEEADDEPREVAEQLVEEPGEEPADE